MSPWAKRRARGCGLFVRRVGLWLVIALASSGWMGASAARSPRAWGADGALRWSSPAVGRAAEPAVAVAVDPTGSRVAGGTSRGVWSLDVDGEADVAVALGASSPVSDLLYDTGGGLWVATEEGLWWHGGGPGQPLLDASPGLGEAARRVHRLARAGDVLAAATDAGVFVSWHGVGWQRVSTVGNAVRVLALECGPERCGLWWFAGGRLWRAALRLRPVESSGFALRVEELVQHAILGAPTAASPVDLVLGSPLGDVIAVYGRALAVRSWRAVPMASRPGGPPSEWPSGGPPAEAARPGWTIWRPVIPPGATARRLMFAFGDYWLATDRGLLRATDPRLGWARAAPPAGSLAIGGLAQGETEVWAATGRGVIRGSAAAISVEPSGGVADVGRPQASRSTGEPTIQEVQRLALHHLGLDPGRARALRRRAIQRSWWPKVELGFGYGGDRARRRDRDQTYSSGAMRQLFDRDRSRGDDWDAGLELRWDLAAAIFDPELIDLAREQRAQIALRDDVLDEITQLYFERLRVLGSLAALRVPGGAAEAASEAVRLRQRAAELAAGLDAWTGGAFSRPQKTHPPGPGPE